VSAIWTRGAFLDAPKDRSSLRIGAPVVLFVTNAPVGPQVGLVEKIHPDDEPAATGVYDEAGEVRVPWTGERPLIDAVFVVEDRAGGTILHCRVEKIAHHRDVEAGLRTRGDPRSVEWFPRYLVIPEVGGA
jgi:hypothetical protein